MRIRSELIIFFLMISVIPLSTVVYISYDYSKEAISESVMSNLLGATENIGNAIDNWMDTRKDDIRVISRSRIVVNTEKDRISEYLNTFESENKGVYNEFLIIDIDGNIIFSTLNRTGNVDEERYFTEAARGKMYITDVFLSENTDSPEIIIANPVKKSGKITGILAARVSMENLYRIIENIDIGKSGEIFIVDRDGNLVIGHRLSPPFLPESMSIDMRVKCLTLINTHDSFKSSFNSTISKY